MSIKAEKSKKTWAREVSAVLMLFCGYLAYKNGPTEAADFFWPVIAFSIPAFGLKQESIQDFLNR